MNLDKFFTFIGWFILCFLACGLVGLLIIGIIIGILLLLKFNVYVAAGIIISIIAFGVIALCMTIDIMKED